MKNFSAGLLGLTLLFSPIAEAATAVPRLEPTGDIIVNGRDVEWNAESNAGYIYAEEQAEYRTWMREEYRAWKGQWKEPLDAERFGEQHRLARQILAAGHRRAVRTGNWSRKPRLVVSTEPTAEAPVVVQQYNRPSRRSIILEAEARNAVKVPATMRARGQ